MTSSLKFERKHTLELKGVDGEVRSIAVKTGPKLMRYRFSRGDWVFHQGDPGDLAFVIETGRISIVQQRMGSHAVSATVEIGTAEPGTMFGELALIDGLPRTAGAKAATKTSCIAVSASQLEPHLQAATPDLANRVRVLLAFVRAVPGRATWKDGVCPPIPSAELLAVHSAILDGTTDNKIDISSPFMRAIYEMLCRYAKARLP